MTKIVSWLTAECDGEGKTELQPGISLNPFLHGRLTSLLLDSPSGCTWCLWFCCSAKDAPNRKHERKRKTCLVYIFSKCRNGWGWGSWGYLISKLSIDLTFHPTFNHAKKLYWCDVMSLSCFIVKKRCIPGISEIPQMKTDPFSWENMQNVCLFRTEQVTDWFNQRFWNPVLEGLNPARFSTLPGSLLALAKAVFWLDRKLSWFAAFGDWVPTPQD